LLEIVNVIKADKAIMLAKIKAMGKKMDAEDLEAFEEEIERVSKGLHHVMEINGAVMQNMGEDISTHVATSLLPIYA
jgi:hypothetical protein